MKIEIKPSKLSGTIYAPPSKSMAHRLLICGGLSKGKSIVHGIAQSDDIMATLDCLSAIGASYTYVGDTVEIQGAPMENIADNLNLYCRESGSTLRFFIPICLYLGKATNLYGSATLLSRPMGVYEDICKKQNIYYKNDGTKISLNGKLKGGDYKIQGNISSQFISGLLFALPMADGNSTINIVPPIESCSYINLTISAMAEFGVKIKWIDERTLFIPGNQRYVGKEVWVEGDYSNAAFFDAFNHLGSDIKIQGLSETSIQGDRVYKEFFELLDKGTPTIHLGDCPDLGPILFALSSAKNGGIFTGTHRLKIKESDRGMAMAKELEKFGVSVKVEEDTIIVYPIDFHKPTEELFGHNDHRIVMALSVLLTLTGGVIEGSEAVKKSMPDFFDKLKEVGGIVYD